MQGKKHKECKAYQAWITVIFVIFAVFTAIVVYDADPQVPLVFGCLAAGLTGYHLGYSWEEILDGMIHGITESLEAILILLMIGMLVGSWIAAGTVPTLIAFGLHIVTARTFLPAAMVICLLTAFAIGSWGAIGTMGLALMGIGISIKIPLPLTAGAVISGAYMGEVISPLSDATNLAAAIAGADVFRVVKKTAPAAIAAGLISLVFYTAAGLHYGNNGAEAVSGSIASMLESLHGTFRITPLTLLPLILILLCILAKIPAIPSMLFGAIAGMAEAFLLQGYDPGEVLSFACSGYVCRSGNELMDTLFTAGGMEAMLKPVSMILIAMAFGGIMKATKQMDALVSPIVSHIHTAGSITALTVVTCVFMNTILPDQYLAIAVPGQMYSEKFKKHSLSTSETGAVLLGGGAVTSPLIPWNTCGMYCMAILQVRPAEYAPYAVYGILLPIVVILSVFLFPVNKGNRLKKNS